VIVDGNKIRRKLRRNIKMADKKSPLTWGYIAVQHADFVAVHRAAYNTDELVAVAPTQETLTDVSTEHLTNFLSQVMVGITAKPTIDEETFLRLSSVYPLVYAQDQDFLRGEESAPGPRLV
jgi:hypothetical protein